jgi:hypothetical protein
MVDVEHVVVVLETDRRVELTCRCGWTAWALDVAEAERMAADHEGRGEVPVKA